MSSFTRFPWDQQPQQQPKYPGISPMPGGPSSLSTYTPPPQPSTGGFNGADGLAAFAQQLAAQAQQSGNLRLQGQREFTSGRHLGMDGTDINPSTGRSSGNAFDSGFFKSGASQLTPEALLASQGNNAMNQWAQRGGVQGVNSTELARMNQVRQEQGVYNPPPATTWQNPTNNTPLGPNPGTVLNNTNGTRELYDSGSPYITPGTSLAGFTAPGNTPRPLGSPIISDEQGPVLRAAGMKNPQTGKPQPGGSSTWARNFPS